mgnify:CR=1 FL=1
MELTDQQIKDWMFTVGQNLSDAEVVNAMAANNVSLDRMNQIFGWDPADTQPRYDKAMDAYVNQLADYLTGSKPDLATTYNDANLLNLSNGLVDLATNKLIDKAYSKQLGANATDYDLTAGKDYIYNGPGYAAGLNTLNNSQTGYNYDTQDIVSAYRQVLGRNPTQKEYVSTMAQLGGFV